MLKLKRKAILTVLILVLGLTVMPPRHGYGMSTLKNWVNLVRPGTFPELDSEKAPKPSPDEEIVEENAELTETERKILLRLMERKRQLDERDTLLNQREEQLRLMRDNVQQQIAKLERLQSDIEASMDAKRQQDAENLQKVVNLYNGMEPRRAAEKIQTLEPKVAVKILIGMNQRKAARVLEQMPAESAKRITEAIVARDDVIK